LAWPQGLEFGLSLGVEGQGRGQNVEAKDSAMWSRYIVLNFGLNQSQFWP